MPSYQFLEPGESDDATLAVKLIPGVLDTGVARAVAAELSRLVAESCRHNLLLDFGNVSFLSAAVLGRLVALHVELRADGGGLTLCNVPPFVCGVLEITRLTEVFNVRATPGRSILVVEDNAATRAAMKTLLEREGYAVTCAGDGREALDRLRQDDPPALILLDLAMDGMDGWQFRRAQGLDPILAPIPVVVVSATSDVAESAAALGAAGCFRKPFAPGELVEAIRQFLA